MKLILLLLAIPALAAAPKPPTNPNEKKDIAEDKTLVTAPPVDWIKTYSLAPYSVSWNVTVNVKDLSKDLPKVLKLMEKEGAALTVPAGQSPAAGGSQQLSYKLEEKQAKAALKKLRKLGSVPEPKITHMGEAISTAEVGEKLGKLTVERNMHRQELQSMPSINTMVDEMIEHLTMVKQVREDVGSKVVFNMTVREKR